VVSATNSLSRTGIGITVALAAAAGCALANTSAGVAYHHRLASYACLLTACRTAASSAPTCFSRRSASCLAHALRLKAASSTPRSRRTSEFSPEAQAIQSLSSQSGSFTASMMDCW
jgi:hypothetical protein